jgi:hypothetical protein
MREASQGMSGKSHSCQARSRPSADQAGSRDQSALVETRAGQDEPSRGTAAISQASSRSSTKAIRLPSGEAAGAEARPSRERHRNGPPVAGTATRRPSPAA